MDLIIALVAAAVLAACLRPLLMRHASIAYVAVVAVDLLFLSGALGSVLPDLQRELLPFLRKGLLPYALFALVMYLGVLPEASRVRRLLMPVRGQLSLVAALLAACHVGSYAPVYLGVALKGFGSAEATTIASLCLAAVVLCLLIVLSVTSLVTVRHHMAGNAWRTVQKLAYPFFALATLHAVVLLLPASATRPNAALSVSIYVGLLSCYAILRIARWASSTYGNRTASARSVDDGQQQSCVLP